MDNRLKAYRETVAALLLASPALKRQKKPRWAAVKKGRPGVLRLRADGRLLAAVEIFEKVFAAHACRADQAGDNSCGYGIIHRNNHGPENPVFFINPVA